MGVLIPDVLCLRIPFFVLLHGYFADPGDRITLQVVAEHPWVVGDMGPIPEYICRCGFGRRERNDFRE